MVVCQPGSWEMAKSKLTTVWTETTSGVPRPAMQQVADPVVLPGPGRAAPAEGEEAVDGPLQPGGRGVAQRGEVGDQPHVPEEEGDGGVGGDGEDVPGQRALEVGPEPRVAGYGISHQKNQGRPRWMMG